MRTTLEELRPADLQSFMFEEGAGRASDTEVRRVQPVVRPWFNELSSRTWSLDLPIVMYEMWAADRAHTQALAAWCSLSATEQEALPNHRELEGYLGSTVVVIPQQRDAFFRGIHEVCVSQRLLGSGSLLMISEVFDGNVPLSRASCPIEIEPTRPLANAEALRFARAYCVGDTFAELNLSGAAHRGLIRYPRDAHGQSGSDWRLMLVGPDGVCDVAAVGLTRGLFTGEPWRGRAPEKGFSAPATVTYVAAGADPRDAIESLRSAGSPLAICDPYADRGSLEALGTALGGGRILTRPKGVGERLPEPWVKQHRLVVRTRTDLHDRMVIGPSGAFLVGGSLNGLGKSHCFVTGVDNVMRANVSSAFERLWEAAAPVR